jgi:hypothetical protein
MRENGLNARRKEKHIPAADSNHGLPVFHARKVLRLRALTAVEARLYWVLSWLKGMGKFRFSPRNLTG